MLAPREGESCDLWNRWACANFFRGDRSLAESGFRRALELDPSHREAAVNLAFLLLTQQRLDESVPVLQVLAGRLTEQEKLLFRKVVSHTKGVSLLYAAAPSSAPVPESARTDEAILDSYNKGRTVSTQDIARLYQLLPDPWNLASEEHYQSCLEIATKLTPAYIKQFATVVDFGCGAGCLGEAFRDIGHTGCRVGIDAFDTRAVIESSLHYRDPSGNTPYHEFWNTDEYTTCSNPAPQGLQQGNLLLCFMNSSYYLFKEKEKIRALGVKTRAEAFVTLIEKFKPANGVLNILTVITHRRSQFLDDILREDMGYLPWSFNVEARNPQPDFKGIFYCDLYRPVLQPISRCESYSRTNGRPQ